MSDNHEILQAQIDGMIAMLGPLVGVGEGRGTVCGKAVRWTVEWDEPVEPYHEAMAREVIAAARKRCGMDSTTPPVSAPPGGDGETA